jgi:trk system potassium uptake protein
VNAFRVGYVLGWILVFLTGAMALPFLISLIYNDGDSLSLLYSMLASLLSGGLVISISRKRGKGELSVREGFAVVTLAWVVMSLFGALPFLFSGTTSSLIDALFESMSGFTTTGASIFVSPEALPHGVGFWRCFMQWIGGLGIVLFGLALLPMLGVGGMHLYKAETPGPSSEKITPRLKDTAKILWWIYITFTLIEILLLKLGGMNAYDAAAHSFTTMATGGFSTHDASIAYFNSPFIYLVMTLFMFFAGINFSLYFRALQQKSLLPVFKDAEWRVYASIITCVVLGLVLVLTLAHDFGVFDAVVASLFQTLSIMTTTGFATEDFNLWHPFGRVALFFLMFVGGMAGSTGGGMKVVRVKIAFAHAHMSLRRMIQPQAVNLIRMGERAVSSDLVQSISGFVMIFFLLTLFGTLSLAALGHDLEVALTGTVACLSNIGPGLGSVGPSGNFSAIHPLGKLILTGLMLLGRLELFTVLVLFSRRFWMR